MNTKREILNLIKQVEDKIVLELEKLGLKSKYERNKNRVQKSNPTMAIITDELNRGFYGYTTKTIKEKLSYYNKSLYTLMDVTHLRYRLHALEEIYYHIVHPNFDRFSEVKEQLSEFSYLTGKKYKDLFKQQNKYIPYTHLTKINPVNTIKTIFMDRTNRFKEDKSIDENNIREQVLSLSKLLQEELPKHFKENKAYGQAIGTLTLSFYGLTSKELIDVFRRYEIKISNSNVIYLMDKKHLEYRFISLLLIKKYMEIHKPNEYDSFIEKCDMIGYISKMMFRETHGKIPYQDLLEINKRKILNLKASENIKKGSYTLEEISPRMIGEPVQYEQLSMFPKERHK